MAESGYLFSQAVGGALERERLDVLARYSNADTIRRLEALGVPEEGWSCLDVGAGAGSIARWLGDRVGPRGRVVATDLETDALEGIAAPNLEVVRHDIVADPAFTAEFDLVHARYLLMHLERSGEAIDNMIEAVKPGGWIVVCETDMASIAPATQHELFERVVAAATHLYAGAAIDPRYGLRLPDELEAHGLVGVEADSSRRYTRGNSLASQFFALTAERLREQFIASGRVDERELDQFFALLADPDFAFWTMTSVVASGRRPDPR